MFIAELIVIVFLLFLSAIFSMIEASFLSVSAIKVHAFVHEKRPGSQSLARLKQQPQRLIISILAANTFVNFTALTIAGVVMVKLNPEYGTWIATILMTIIVLFFSQVTPKIIAEKHADKLALFFAGSAETFTHILFPIVIIIEKLSFKISEKFGMKTPKAVSEEEFEAIVTMGRKDGILSTESAEIMRNVLVFQNTSLTQIMTPRANAVMVQKSQKIEEIVPILLKAEKTRIPVYEETDSNIVGVLSVVDALKAVKQKKAKAKVETIMKNAYFIPETKDIQDLLYELESTKSYMGVVVNEYGTFIGIVTIHDLLKLIVGKGEDNKSTVKRVPKNKIIIGKTTLTDFSEIFGIKLEDENVKTIAGLIEKQLQHIPEKGEKIQYKGFYFEIMRVTKKQIQEIKVTKQN